MKLFDKILAYGLFLFLAGYLIAFFADNLPTSFSLLLIFDVVVLMVVFAMRLAEVKK